jgi:hypothetical protein
LTRWQASIVLICSSRCAGGSLIGASSCQFRLSLSLVDAVLPIPVVAAGGIYDGRVSCRSFHAGAVRVNIGARFPASREAPIDDDLKQAIIEAHSVDAARIPATLSLRSTAGPGVLRAALLGQPHPGWPRVACVTDDAEVMAVVLTAQVRKLDQRLIS